MEIDINLILGQGSCSIRPTFLGKTLFIHSEEYPIMHDVLLDMVHRDHYSGVKTDDLQAVLYLKNHSLKDALYDNSLSQEEVRNIVRKKSVELYMYMMLNMKREVFHKFYMDSIAKDYFTEIPLEEYYRKFRQSFGFSLDTLVADWYYTKGYRNLIYVMPMRSNWNKRIDLLLPIYSVVLKYLTGVIYRGLS